MESSTPNRGEPFPLDEHRPGPVTGDPRDTVTALTSDDSAPAIVSISDIHGYLEEARSALLTLTDHPDFDPVVETDDSNQLHWAGNDYVLVFNGGLIDRGPKSAERVRMVGRLLDQAPPGRVWITLGNHEMGVLAPSVFGWDDWFSGRVGSEGRRALVEQILHGHVIAAYRGYNVTYAHAGQPEEYEPTAVNDCLLATARQLHGLIGGGADEHTQYELLEDHPTVLGTGEYHSRGPDAGLAWLDFQHMPKNAPPQVVGHTRHETVTVKGPVVCQNVIRNTLGSPGGEAVVVETPDSLTALQRDLNEAVSKTFLSSHSSL